MSKKVYCAGCFIECLDQETGEPILKNSFQEEQLFRVMPLCQPYLTGKWHTDKQYFCNEKCYQYRRQMDQEMAALEGVPGHGGYGGGGGNRRRQKTPKRNQQQGKRQPQAEPAEPQVDPNQDSLQIVPNGPVRMNEQGVPIIPLKIIDGQPTPEYLARLAEAQQANLQEPVQMTVSEQTPTQDQITQATQAYFGNMAARVAQEVQTTYNTPK